MRLAEIVDYPRINRGKDCINLQKPQSIRQNTWKKAQSSRGFGIIRNLPPESSDAPTDDSSDEVTANYLLEFSSDSEEFEQDSDPLC
ncbi:hypothetical protein TNCV_1160271 [Trichonephila clavipes]|nr:hypothetical protein TNCV_1160271 [Trichonephila clavipes]